MSICERTGLACCCQPDEGMPCAAENGGLKRMMLEWRAEAIRLRAVIEADRKLAQGEPVAWRCFHCSESFTGRDAAQEHFGPSEHDKPICQMDARYIRWLLEQHRRNVDDDSEALRTVRSLVGEHETLRRRAEELGYARGLAAAMKHPEDIGLAAPQLAQPRGEPSSAINGAAFVLYLHGFMQADEQFDEFWGTEDHVAPMRPKFESLLASLSERPGSELRGMTEDLLGEAKRLLGHLAAPQATANDFLIPVTLPDGAENSAHQVERDSLPDAALPTPAGFIPVLVMGLSELLETLERAAEKGYMPDAMIDAWEAFDYRYPKDESPHLDGIAAPVELSIREALRELVELRAWEAATQEDWTRGWDAASAALQNTPGHSV